MFWLIFIKDVKKIGTRYENSNQFIHNSIIVHPILGGYVFKNLK